MSVLIYLVQPILAIHKRGGAESILADCSKLVGSKSVRLASHYGVVP